MKKWIAKAIVQKTISFLPARDKINYLFQKYITKGVYLTDEYFVDRLVHGRDHLNAYKKFGPDNPLNTTLELGTGWYPVVPISFFLSGVMDIYTIDISLLTNKDRIKTTLLKFVEYYQSDLLQQYLDIKPERWQIIITLLNNYETLSFQQMTEALKIHYLIQDARRMSLPDSCIDLVNSNNTFEHIYPEILKPILKEMIRVVKPNGVMSHFIDMSDHFAHFDKNINIYNFLQYSDSQWALIDNDIQPQSRLRYADYIDMYLALNIPVIDTTQRTGNIEEVSTVTLAKKYCGMTKQSLAISHCHIISKM